MKLVSTFPAKVEQQRRRTDPGELLREQYDSCYEMERRQYWINSPHHSLHVDSCGGGSGGGGGGGGGSVDGDHVSSSSGFQLETYRSGPPSSPIQLHIHPRLLRTYLQEMVGELSFSNTSPRVVELSLKRNFVTPQHTFIPVSLLRLEEETYCIYQSDRLQTTVRNNTHIPSLDEYQTSEDQHVVDVEEGQDLNIEVHDKMRSSSSSLMFIRDKVTDLSLAFMGISASYLLNLMGASYILIALLLMAFFISLGIFVHPKIRDYVIIVIFAFLTLVSKLKSFRSVCFHNCFSQYCYTCPH